MQRSARLDTRARHERIHNDHTRTAAICVCGSAYQRVFQFRHAAASPGRFRPLLSPTRRPAFHVSTGAGSGPGVPRRRLTNWSWADVNRRRDTRPLFTTVVREELGVVQAFGPAVSDGPAASAPSALPASAPAPLFEPRRGLAVALRAKADKALARSRRSSPEISANEGGRRAVLRDKPFKRAGSIADRSNH